MVTRAITIGSLALAVGASGANPPMVCWSKTGRSTPRYSTWNGSGWSAAAEAPSVGNEPVWIVARECPTREEHACLSLDYDKDVNVILYTGTSWGTVTEVCTDTDGTAGRCMDMAYGQASGTLLVAYWSKSSLKVGYRTSTGGAFTAQSTLTLPTITKVNYLRLYPKPGSDEIVLLALNDSSELYAAVWSGSSWSAITTIDTNIEQETCEGFSFAYESSSGAGLLVYSEKDVATPRYRTLASGSWSSELSLPSFGGDGYWVRLAAKPASDQITCAVLDDRKDLSVCTWDGSAWGSTTELETNTGFRNRRLFDVAYSGSGGSCVVAYGQSGQSAIRYRTLSGSTWSSEQTGPNVGDKVVFVQVSPDSNGTDLWVLCADNSDDLSVMRYASGTLSLISTLETSLGGNNKTEQFMLSVPASSTTTRKVVSWQHAKPE